LFSKNGLPWIIGLEVLLLMSITIKSTGTKVIYSSIMILSTLPKAFLVEPSASKRSISHFYILLSRSSKSYNYLERILTLDPKSNIAWCDYFPIVTNIFGIQTSASFGGIIASLLYLCIFSFIS
jgi:hypothetical protein